MGVAGEDGDDFAEDTARICVGNAEDDGELEEGRIGTSREGGRRDFGRELGVDNRFTAAIMLYRCAFNFRRMGGSREILTEAQAIADGFECSSRAHEQAQELLQR